MLTTALPRCGLGPAEVLAARDAELARLETELEGLRAPPGERAAPKERAVAKQPPAPKVLRSAPRGSGFWKVVLSA